MGLAIPPAAGSGTTYTTAAGQAALTASLQPLVQACMVRIRRRKNSDACSDTHACCAQNYPNMLFWMIGNEVEDPPNQGYGAQRTGLKTACGCWRVLDARRITQARCFRT